MSFKHLIGNTAIKERLTRMVESERIGQAFLFGGMAGVGKYGFARAFAQQLLGIKKGESEESIDVHPDLFLFRGEGKSGLHSMENLRALCTACRQSPYQAERRVFIIDQADRMLPTSANALLKSFEEPAKSSVIILVSDHPELLLDTILSRCQRFFFQAVPSEDLARYLAKAKGFDIETAKRIAVQAQGSVARALEFSSGEGQELRQQVIATLWAARQRRFDRVQLGSFRLAELLEKQREQEEANLRERWLPEESRDWGAVQRHAIEQQIIGAGALCYQRGLDGILDIALSWCRDLHACMQGGPLINVDYRSSLQQSLQLESPHSLEKALEASEKARLAIQRSFSLTSLLEAFFLSL